MQTIVAGGPAPAASRSVKHSAYERFQQALLTGRLRPGQVLSQRDLVAMLGVSLGALRELLPRLETELLLRVMPQRGIQITTVDLRMIRDAYQLRTAYEREATLTAVDKMPDEVLARLKAVHLDILARAKVNMTPALLDEAQNVDTDFHNRLIAETDNELLIQAYAVNAIRVRLIKLDRIRLTPLVLAEAFQDHLDIIEAIQSRDHDRACAAIERHMRNARDRAVAL